MNSLSNPSHSISPSYPSGQQVSQDIFFQVKKQILDKLDIILQKVNLQVIEYLKPQNQRKESKKNFKFIELSEFQKQIQSLFDYLDRLYSSLNASISFSTNDIKNNIAQNHFLQTNQSSSFQEELNSMKQKCKELSEQNVRLYEQNEHMKFIVKNHISNSHSLGHSINQESKSSLKNTQKSRQHQRSSGDIRAESVRKSQAQLLQPAEGISLQTVKKILRFYNHSIKQYAQQYRQTVKQVKKILKQVKFQIIQSRVQCIAELKKYSQKVEMELALKQSTKLNESKQKQNKKVDSVRKSVSVQSLKQNQSVEQYCGQNCAKRNYLQSGLPNPFEQSILLKIQQILDVC